jgi:hypothetical protein
METGSQQSSPYSYSSPIAFAPAPAFFPEPTTCYGYASSATAQPNQYAVPQSQGYSMPEATSQHSQPTEYSNFPQSGGTPDAEMSNQPPPINVSSPSPTAQWPWEFDFSTAQGTPRYPGPQHAQPQVPTYSNTAQGHEQYQQPQPPPIIGYPPNPPAQVPQWPESTYGYSAAQGTPGDPGQQHAQPQVPTYSNTAQDHEQYQQPQPPPINGYPPNPPAQVPQWPPTFDLPTAQGTPGDPGPQHAQPQAPTYANTVPPPQGHKEYYKPEPSQPQKNKPPSQAGQQQDNRHTNPPPAWPYPPVQNVQFQTIILAPGHTTHYVPFMIPPVPAAPQDKSSPPSSMYI